MHEGVFYNALAVHLESDYRRLGDLKKKFGRWSEAWQAIAKETDVDPEAQWKKLEVADIRLVMIEDEDYPKLLKEIPWPPFGIYIRGDLADRSVARLAIVGTRKATAEGKEFAKKLARELASQGAEIVSGLAFGIDGAAHTGALDAHGTTIAVLAHGLDRMYPRSHEGIAQIIVAEGGALISEYPPESPSYPSRFIERNRIVSGLSQGIIIIEAPKESGALATARFASEQNREIMVVPGPAKHPNYAGSHELIRSGALLVTGAGHVLEALGFEYGAPSIKSGEFRGTAEEAAILTLLKDHGAPLSIDKIIELTNLNAQTVNQTMTFLMMQGKVKEIGEGYAMS